MSGPPARILTSRAHASSLIWRLLRRRRQLLLLLPLLRQVALVLVLFLLLQLHGQLQVARGVRARVYKGKALFRACS